MWRGSARAGERIRSQAAEAAVARLRILGSLSVADDAGRLGPPAPQQRSRAGDNASALRLAPPVGPHVREPASGVTHWTHVAAVQSAWVYLRGVAPRTSILAFGSLRAVAVAGGLCVALIHGLIGHLLAFVLISFALGGAVLLVFLDVGLSEDRGRAREQERVHERERERAREAERARIRAARLANTARVSRVRPPQWRRRPS